MRPVAVVLVVSAALLSSAAHAADTQDRRQFVAAEQALERDDSATFARLEKQLRAYPLHPYLVYAALTKRLDDASDADVEQFLRRYADTPLAWQLRNRWLNRLAKQGRWQSFLAFYTPSTDAARKCQHLQALMATGQRAAAMSQVKDVWLQGRSQPSACDPVFAAWIDAGQRTPALIWQRIDKAMAAGQWRLANYLSRDLSTRDRAWVNRWVDLYKDPASVTDHARFATAHPYREAMLAQAVRRLARANGLDALHAWQAIKPTYRFTAAQVQRTEHYIVRNLERELDDEAYAFIAQVDVGADDERVHEARIRAALLREDWPRVAEWITALPLAQRDEVRWEYWLARALEGMNKQAEARALYARAATERSYYGFMAADRIGAPYHLVHAETPATEDLIAKIAKQAAVARARELFALERWTDARREWQLATSKMDSQQLRAAAKLAMRNGWHDRAIFTLAKTGFWDDLELRFPLQHADLVEQNAAKHQIDDAWVFAVMRQESAFMRHAQSHAGAMGLMQLMPATARNVARDVLKRKPPRRTELLDPDTNIALGSAYLKQMMGELGDSAVLATAAYNAGPHRVARWLPARTLPADIWIELVPFRETRGYLRRVLAYTVIYEKRMGKDPTRLRKRLHPVTPDIQRLGAIHDRPAQASAG